MKTLTISIKFQDTYIASNGVVTKNAFILSFDDEEKAVGSSSDMLAYINVLSEEYKLIRK